MRTSRFFSDQMLLFLAACVALSFLCQIFKLTALVNIIYVITLLLVLLCYVGSGYISKVMTAMVLFIFFAAFAHGFKYSDLDYYTHILITMCIFICIEVSANVRISVQTFRKIADIFFVTSIILLIAFYFGPLKETYFNYRIGSISLNFHNPNAAGMWVTCIFVLVMYSSFLFKRYKRAMYIAVALALLPIILATQARNSFFACILFVVGLIAIKFLKIKTVPKWVLFTLTVLPLIVFVFYMYVIVANVDFWESLFSLNTTDKGLDTRQGIWQKVLDDFGHCFLFGDYYEYYNSQMHNSLMTIFCRFGAPVMVFACVIIYRTLKKLQRNASIYAVLSLGAILLTGCFEASVFVGIAGMYLMLLLIPACASVENVGLQSNSSEGA